jgi:hypothetical protein
VDTTARLQAVKTPKNRTKIHGFLHKIDPKSRVFALFPLKNFHRDRARIFLQPQREFWRLFPSPLAGEGGAKRRMRGSRGRPLIRLAFGEPPSPARGE